MDLKDAIAAVDRVRDGEKVRFDWNDWCRAESLLRENGHNDLAERAHSESIRAYHKEEYDADLL